MNRLKFWRLERSLSQHALAEVSGVPRHVVQLSELGLGVPQSDHKNALAKALGVRASKLFPESTSAKQKIGSASQMIEKCGGK